MEEARFHEPGRLAKQTACARPLEFSLLRGAAEARVHFAEADPLIGRAASPSSLRATNRHWRPVSSFSPWPAARARRMIFSICRVVKDLDTRSDYSYRIRRARPRHLISIINSGDRDTSGGGTRSRRGSFGEINKTRNKREISRVCAPDPRD